MKANIVTIGDEILIGQVIDTNSAFIARELNHAGISVHRIITVGDTKGEIYSALSETDNSVKIVLITGGLGPTGDDITKPALVEYFGGKLLVNKDALKNIREFLERKKLPFNDRNLKQAEIPDNCELIPNLNGTASGMWFEKNNKLFISLPGVPFEMQDMMTDYVIPKLQARFALNPVIHKTIITSGIPESVMADRISEWENSLPVSIKLAYLPSPGILRLRLSSLENNDKAMLTEIENQTEKLNTILGKAVVGYDNDTMEGKIGELLSRNNKTISVAESCTGGYISKLITSIPGASNYFMGGLIAYSNEIKIKNLKVSENDINQFGAVSESVVRQMADGILKLYSTDYSIATSGIAGPDGGSPEKPVGTTWIAVASGTKNIAEIFQFGDNRERNIQRASIAALNLLRLFIQKTL